MEENIQLAILGKCLMSDDILRKVIQVENLEKLNFTGSCKDLFEAEFNLFRSKHVVDSLLAVEELRRLDVQDEISIVRSALNAAYKVSNNKIIEILDSILDNDEREKVLTCRERLKVLNNNLLKTAAECIVNKEVKKIDKIGTHRYRVRLSGGLYITFDRDNLSFPLAGLPAMNIERFPVSFKLIEDLYKELQDENIQKEVVEELNGEQKQEPSVPQETQVPQVPQEPQKPKSFFEKFLKH